MLRPNTMDVNMMKPRPYSIHWLIAGLAALLILIFFPYLFGGKTFLPSDMFDTMMGPFNAHYGPPQVQNHFPFDGIAQTYPYKFETKQALSRGKLSYWNPHILGGYPEYAETMANNFDVFNILLLWFEPDDVIHLETIIELFVAGVGMLLLLRFMGVAKIINFTFAAGFMLNSLFIGNAMHRWIIAACCWVPFTILMVLRFFQTKNKNNLLYSSLFLALSFLGGNLQTSFFAAFIVTVVLLFYSSENVQLSILKRIGYISGIGLVAFALTSIMWLPTLELMIQTLYHGGNLTSSGVVAGYSLLQRLLSVPLLGNFFLPGVLGDTQIYSVKKFAGADFNEFNGSIGFVPMLFGVWGVFKLRKKKELRPFILLAILGILVPLATPFFFFVYHRFFILTSFSLCIVGAVMFQSLIENEKFKESLKGVLKWTSILFSLMISGLALLWVYIASNYESLYNRFISFVTEKIHDSNFGVSNESWMLGRVGKTLYYYSSFSIDLWVPIFGAALSILTLKYYQKGNISKSNLQSLILFFTVLQLFIFAKMWLPSIDLQQFPIYPPNPISSYLQKDSSHGRYLVWRDESKDPYILSRNGSNVYETYDLHGYESLTNRSFIFFYLHYGRLDSLDLRLLGLANCKYIITGKRKITSPQLKYVYSADSVSVYENRLAKPRAYLTFKSKKALRDSDIVKELFNPDFDGTVALFNEPEAPEFNSSITDTSGYVSITKSEDENVEMTAVSRSKSILIVTDTYYPGWKCYVNGIETPIHRVNYSMRGVILDNGTSSIVFRFEPDIFRAGASISTITGLLCLVFVILLKRKKPDNRSI